MCFNFFYFRNKWSVTKCHRNTFISNSIFDLGIIFKLFKFDREIRSKWHLCSRGRWFVMLVRSQNYLKFEESWTADNGPIDLFSEIIRAQPRLRDRFWSISSVVRPSTGSFFIKQLFKWHFYRHNFFFFKIIFLRPFFSLNFVSIEIDLCDSSIY